MSLFDKAGFENWNNVRREKTQSLNTKDRVTRNGCLHPRRLHNVSVSSTNIWVTQTSLFDCHAANDDRRVRSINNSEHNAACICSGKEDNTCCLAIGRWYSVINWSTVLCAVHLPS
jgi:hypothetical protein